VTRRRKATRPPDKPISGVAAGSLGTAANLDDTQVLRTEDLEAAAPAWLEADGPAVAEEADAMPPDELALLHTRPTQVPPAPAPPAPGALAPAALAPAARASGPVQSVRSQPRPRSRSVPALAGVAALFVLLLIAGTGILSQLDLGVGAGAEPSTGAKTLVEAAPSPTAKPRKQAGGRDHGKCDGHGHGKGCQGGED
jgi:hypothetical protein